MEGCEQLELGEVPESGWSTMQRCVTNWQGTYSAFFIYGFTQQLRPIPTTTMLLRSRAQKMDYTLRRKYKTTVALSPHYVARAWLCHVTGNGHHVIVGPGRLIS